MVVRDAVESDAATCADIYRPYVLTTAITFELDPPSAQDMAQRIADAQHAYAWFVAETDDGLVGYAYGGRFAARPAYRFACEVSVYTRIGVRRTGTGRALYAALLPRLADLGYRRAMAGMTLPNAASEGLHRAMGFRPGGVYRRVGWKFDSWHDVAWLQRDLETGGADPARPPTSEPGRRTSPAELTGGAAAY